MNDAIIAFLKYADHHPVVFKNESYLYCKSITCFDCIIYQKECKDALSDIDLKFLKENYPEYFL